MKIFKELNKLGYKHYTEHTVEELDKLPLESKERVMEQALVLRWFRKKYGLSSEIEIDSEEKWTFSIYNLLKLNSLGIYGEQYEFFEEAELECVKKLIEIVKTKQIGL